MNKPVRFVVAYRGRKSDGTAFVNPWLVVHKYGKRGARLAEHGLMFVFTNVTEALAEAKRMNNYR